MINLANSLLRRGYSSNRLTKMLFCSFANRKIGGNALSQLSNFLYSTQNIINSSKIIQQSEKRNLSEMAQRAVWAFQIIYAIRQGKQSQSDRTQSLLDHLKKLQIDNKLPVVMDTKIREEMLDMFENGVVLNFDKFPQYRVMKARENSGINKRKFIFCPTYLVTTKIFRGLYNGSLGNLLI